jgi:hypothetical protein
VFPFALEHAAPHAPQFAVVDSVVSHPFEARPSQLPKPLLHAIAHVDALHEGVPWFELHACPQAPQLVRLFAVSVSQPLLLLPSQSLKAPAQTGVQTPATQLVVPCAFVQAFPHAPQAERLVCTSVSHPFPGLPSQSAKPAKQVGAHAPPAHATVPFALVQLLPHPPQLFTPVFRFASHPFVAMPSQLANPVLHVGAQLPAAHAVAPFGFVHVVPHAPQLFRFVCVFVSHPLETLLSQLPNPGSQAMEHAPSEQLAVPFALLQALPQLPQFATLELVFTSQPLVVTPSQFAKPEEHALRVHVPEGHDSLAFGKLHVEPHAPQFVSVLSDVSQPFAESPSQSPRPGLQVETPHTPATQFGVPPAGGHTLLHSPQLLMFVCVLVSQPFAGLPSQFPEPALHAGTHTPPVQAVVPFEFVQPAPQAPQFVVVVSDVSQPLTGSPSQLPQPAMHVGAHVPATQAVVPWALVHAFPHAPQLPVVA